MATPVIPAIVILPDIIVMAEVPAFFTGEVHPVTMGIVVRSGHPEAVRATAVVVLVQENDTCWDFR